MSFGKWQKFDPRMLATNAAFRKKEAIKLYREVLRTCRMFTWTDENGVPWSQLIKASAREEFESSKQEKDPEVLARALVNARMAIDELHEKYKSQQMKLESDLIAHVNDTRTDRTQTRTVLGQNLRSSHVPFHSSVRIDPSSFPTFPGFKKP